MPDHDSSGKRTRRTRPFIPLVSLVFDFDLTLATHSLDAITQCWGITKDEWKERFDEPLGTGWDEILRHGRALLDAGEAMGRPMSSDLLREAAGNVRLFEGVLDMPDRLRAVARDVHPEVGVEFVVLSSGFAELISATPIARAFDRIYCSTYHFEHQGSDGEYGRAMCMKRMVAHAEKALYLQAHAKGLSVDDANGPEHAGRPVAPESMHVPFEQMIYCGDGESDLQAFGFIEKEGGRAIAVAGDGTFAPENQTRAQRVENIAPPSYSADGELMRTLEHAVRAAASIAAMRALGER